MLTNMPVRHSSGLRGRRRRAGRPACRFAGPPARRTGLPGAGSGFYVFGAHHGQNCWIRHPEQAFRGACGGRGHAGAHILVLVAALPGRRACGPGPAPADSAWPGTLGARPGRTSAGRHRRPLLAARAGPAAQGDAAAVCAGVAASIAAARRPLSAPQVHAGATARMVYGRRQCFRGMARGRAGHGTGRRLAPARRHRPRLDPAC